MNLKHHYYYFKKAVPDRICKEFEDKDAPMPREKEQALNLATS